MSCSITSFEIILTEKTNRRLPGRRRRSFLNSLLRGFKNLRRQRQGQRRLKMTLYFTHAYRDLSSITVKTITELNLGYSDRFK